MSVIWVVAPEPCPWLPALLRTAGSIGPVQVFAPWALPALAARGCLRSRLGPRAAIALPGWTLLEGIGRLWAGNRTDRAMMERFWRRQLCDQLAARHLPTAARLVIAPSLAARAVLSRARASGIPTMLVQDLPLLRQLHHDLDGAAVRHPDCAFLRRFRAPAAWLARQEAEISLASAVAVGGLYARQTLQDRAQEVVDLEGPEPQTTSIPPRGSEVILAGLATARNGAVEALKLVEAMPLRLRARFGEGSEPLRLRQHPQVAPGRGCAGAGLVIAPTWCETYNAEVGEAARSGVPVIGTRQASGPWDLGQGEFEAGDVEKMLDLVQQALLGRLAPPRLWRPRPWEGWAA